MYLDTSIYLKLLIRESDSAYYAGLIDGQHQVWSSQILITEAYSALLRKERDGDITKDHRRKALKQMEEDLNSDALRLVLTDTSLFKKANRIIEFCHPEIPLRSLDAIHLACYEGLQIGDLITSDTRMRKAAQKMKFSLNELPA